MRAWVLSSGCRFEGGNVLSVYATEESGLKAADEYMKREIASTATMSSPEDPCETYFVKQPEKDGHHYWLEHYRCHLGDNMMDFDHDYLSLKWYELQ